MQRLLIVIGLVIVAIGIAWPWLSKLPFGRLPGDVAIERDNVKLYFPLMTMIVLSVVLSFLLWLFRK
ncbi:MAG: DUF2905 domain-containing protein [Woeseiaceae bacterium]|nr:DUF2905 domain-containing protein [Woeseiaceae bacterium]